MKQTCCNGQQGTYTRNEQEAYIQSGFHCQICNARGSLKPYTRTDDSPEPHDILVLCQDCYDLAQIRKRRRMQGKVSHILGLVCFFSLLLGIVASLNALASLLSFHLFLLCLVSVCAVFLLELLVNRWL